MEQIGNKIIQLDCVDSTNNFAANLLREGKIEHGTVILADEQTAGRGQRGSSWQSEGGSNLIFTLFAEYDNLSAMDQAAVTHWVALSVIDLLANKGIQAAIKWPNDILVGDQKICGVLIENQVTGGQLRNSIIGVGLNVNQQEFQGLRATSIYQLKGMFSDITQVAYGLISTLNRRIPMMGRHKTEYLKRLWKIGEEVDFYRDGQQESGVLLGTDDHGRLHMTTSRGEEYFDLKEISFF